MNAKSALPSLFTIGSLFCGFLSIYYAIDGKLLGAGLLIVIAAFLDAFDGKVARYFDTPSNFGVQFDTISDICSFGLAPAVLMLQYFDDLMASRWLPFGVAFFFLMCGALRLARFNSQLKGFEKENFTGLPIPMAACTLSAYIMFSERVWNSTHEPHLAMALCVLLALLMVSTIEYVTFPKLRLETGRDRARLAGLFASVFLMIFFTYEVFFPLPLVLSLSGAARWLFLLITDREIVDLQP
jgi:CDP-diacylglycerol---serine O-phosphatidyltransferase